MNKSQAQFHITYKIHFTFLPEAASIIFRKYLLKEHLIYLTKIKKIIIIRIIRMNKMALFLFLLFCFSHLYAQNYDVYYVDNIEDKFVGVYLPINFTESLKKTKNFTFSMRINFNENERRAIYGDRRLYHDILIVDKNRNAIFSNLGFHDSYAIRANEVINYKFIERNQNKIVIDNNGYEYQKISNIIENAYQLVEIYIAEIIFEDLIKKKDIILTKNNVIFTNTGMEYRIVLTLFVEGNPNLILEQQ